MNNVDTVANSINIISSSSSIIFIAVKIDISSFSDE